MGTVTPASATRWTAGRVATLVGGSLIGLVALALLIGGGGLLIAQAALRDGEGYFHSRTAPYTTDARALVSKDLSVVSGTPVELGDDDFATVRIRATPRSPDRPVFVGIAEAGDVQSWLQGVAYDRVDDVDFDPFRVTSVRQAGSAVPARPDTLDIWAARSQGTGPQTLRWNVSSGTWSVVVMNADGASGVSVEADIGVKVRHLTAIGVGLLVAGIVLGGGAAALIVAAARRSRRPDDAVRAPTHAIVPAPEIPQAAPVTLEGNLDPGLGRGLWLVKWLLAIPHWIVLVFLWVAFWVMTVVAFFAILFTGRYPRTIFEFNVGVLRWSWRVGFYSYSALGTDRYPPFTLDDAPDYPARLEIAYPERLSRGLIFVKWLLVVPHAILVAVFTGTWTFGVPGFWSRADPDWLWWQGFPGLIGVLVLCGAVALLFSARYPRGIFDLVIGLNRWVYRVWSYAFLMRDDYPPFRLDTGEREPVAMPDGGAA